MIDRDEKQHADIQRWSEITHKYLTIQELNRDVVNELIDHIEIGERAVINGKRQQDMKIYYRFVGLVD